MKGCLRMVEDGWKGDGFLITPAAISSIRIPKMNRFQRSTIYGTGLRSHLHAFVQNPSGNLGSHVKFPGQCTKNIDVYKHTEETWQQLY